MDTDLHSLFEDLYRAQQRLSLTELEEIMEQMEALPVPLRKDLLLAHKMLRGSMQEAITESEKRLQELRARYAALPELQPVKRMLRVVS
jgi:hypothetical protein